MSRQSQRLPWRIRLAAQQFHKERAQYYDYLADLMSATDGRKTLRDIFRDDAKRYGQHHRGLLSGHWAYQYQEAGGDLFGTFDGTLPRSDLVLIRMAQRGGAGALEQTLRDVAVVSRLIEQARGTLVNTLAVAVAAILVMMAMIIAIPLFTVPRLKQAFGMVPEEFIGALTRQLYAFSSFIHEHFFSLALGFGFVTYCLLWSLPNLTGSLRRVLDDWFIWRLYRDFHGIRFLASLATMVKRRGNVSTALRDALDLQTEGASPWQRWHVEQMIAHIDDGRVGSETFDTGIVDRQTLWFLTDLIAAQGMDVALSRTRARLESRSVQAVARRAELARWVMLLGAVAALLGIVFWHFGVVNEMRAAMTNYYSNR